MCLLFLYLCLTLWNPVILNIIISDIFHSHKFKTPYHAEIFRFSKYFIQKSCLISTNNSFNVLYLLLMFGSDNEHMSISEPSSLLIISEIFILFLAIKYVIL